MECQWVPGQERSAAADIMDQAPRKAAETKGGDNEGSHYLHRQQLPEPDGGRISGEDLP